MLIINWEHELKEHPNRETLDQVIYPLIYEQSDNGYYDIFGLKIYATSIECDKRVYAQKIVNFIQSLEDNNFKFHYAEYENPKINKGEFFATVSNCIQPERASEKTPNKCYKCDKQVDENGAIWKDMSSGISYPICADCLSKIFIKRCGAPTQIERSGDNQK